MVGEQLEKTMTYRRGTK